MPRLEPLSVKREKPEVIISVGVTKEMADKISEEQKRIGAKTRSELCRMIFEQYFDQSV